MRKKRFFSLLAVLTILSFIFSSCSTNSRKETSQNLSSSETVFEAVLPDPLQENEVVLFELIDEVTGISINPTRYTMEKKDDVTVFIRLPLENSSLIKYRYVRRADSDTIEYLNNGSGVQFRTYLVSRPAIIKDAIVAWGASGNTPQAGELSGFVYDQKTDLPVSDVFVTVNGNTTMTGLDGYYELKDLSVGEHLITAYHLNGDYAPFQQGAVIAENALTPASFGMAPAKMVEITFEITVPENTVEGAPVRLLGNTYSTGNLFEEMDGGTSILATRAPVMIYDGNSKYHLTLELPVGTDFRYKYSLGDGFVNAEHTEDGNFLTRQYIIPKKDATVYNTVQSWSQDDGNSPVTFYITAPENTPSNDVVSIQFNPFVWLQPLPLWKTGENKWMFTLYSPFVYMDNSQFRFCRNNMCGLADDALTAGTNASGFVLNADGLSQSHSVAYTIEAWSNFSQQNYQIQPLSSTYSKQQYLRSITFTDIYDPQWDSNLQWGVIDTAISGATSLFISPSWKFRSAGDFLLENRLPSNYQAEEIQKLVSYTKDAGLSLNFYPQPAFEDQQSAVYWKKAPLTYNWWQKWFKSYSHFVKNYARLADQQNTNYFVFGGSAISPALPGGKLPSGSPANTPYDFSDQWSQLISEIREIYSGSLIFALPDNNLDSLENYAFLSNVDAVMIEMDSALSASRSPSIGELKARVAQLLDEEFITIPEMYGKPVLLGLNYSAVNGASSDCVDDGKPCAQLLRQDESMEIDLYEQADIYSAVLAEAITRDWIVGINSLGFQPAVLIQDAGPSVHGKPAFDVLSYFFNQVIN